MAPHPIKVRRFDDYVDALHKAKVVLDSDRRKAIILADAQGLAFARGLELVEDEGLLEEVAGLVEWPVVLMGEFEAAFLDLPPEAIRATIRANQKCFVLRDGAVFAGGSTGHPRASGQTRNRVRISGGGQASSPRRRRGDRGRQRPRRARAPRRRASLLAHRPRPLARL